MDFRTTLAGCGIVLLAVSAAGADPVYTWVDHRGVTHFSETPPADPAIEAMQIDLPAIPPSGPAPASDYYSILRLAERMQKSRLERERVRAELLQARAEANRAKAATAATSQAVPEGTYEDNVYYPAFPYYYGYRPGHRPGKPPGYRPGNRPGHRPVRPGLLPGPRYSHAPRRPIAAVTNTR
jgi:hypothetical protein